MRSPGRLAILLLIAATPTPALAYLDPGTGSYVFQAAAAAVISLGFLLRGLWQRLRGALTGRRQADRPRDADGS